MAGEDAIRDDRRWARRITLASVAAPPLLASPMIVRALAHARADSEVGVMMYGFPLFIALLCGCPVVAATTAWWGLGLRRARRRGEVVPRWERVAFGVVAALAAGLMLALSENYLRLIRPR